MQHSVPVFNETIDVITTTNTVHLLSTFRARYSDCKEKLSFQMCSEEIWHIHSCRRKSEVSVYEQDTLKSRGIV